MSKSVNTGVMPKCKQQEEYGGGGTQKIRPGALASLLTPKNIEPPGGISTI